MVHKAIRRLHSIAFPFPKGWMDSEGQAASDLIKAALLSDKPCLISRLGKTEIEAVMASLYQDASPWERLCRFTGTRYKSWHRIAPKLHTLSGVFPPGEACLHRFARVYLDSMPEIDILGSWLHTEIKLQPQVPNARRIPLSCLAPYRFSSPWSQALENRKVLVIPPVYRKHRCAIRETGKAF